jgi:hypothetical protein
VLDVTIHIREPVMLSKAVCGAIAAMVLFAGSQAAQARGTEAEREACTPDAMRLCGRFIPDEDRIEACLRDAGPRLSRACYVVFHPEENAAQPQRPGMRRPLPPPARYDDDDD